MNPRHHSFRWRAGGAVIGGSLLFTAMAADLAAEVSLQLNRLTPIPAMAPAQPSFNIAIFPGSETDANGVTERDYVYHYTVEAVGYTTQTVWVYSSDNRTDTWSDPRGALGGGSYAYNVIAYGVHPSAYNYGWIEGHDEDEHDNPDDPDEVTGSHWVEGHWDAGFSWTSANWGATITITVDSGLGQTISFTAPSTRAFGDAFNPGATASSGLPVSYSIVSGPATVSGQTVTVTGVGTVVLRASQAGGLNASNGTVYQPAASVDRNFSTVKVDQVITFPATPAPGWSYGAQLSVTALGITMSANALTPILTATGPATVSNNIVAITSTSGSVTITASQPGGANHNPATPVSNTSTIVKGTQIITPPSTPQKTISADPFSAAATVNSALPLAYAIVSGAALIDPATGWLTLLGSVAGTVVVQASQHSGDANWNPANPVTYGYSVVVPAGAIVMSMPAISPIQYFSSGQAFPTIDFTTTPTPVGTITAVLQTPAGVPFGISVQAQALPPFVTVSGPSVIGQGNGLLGSYYSGSNFDTLQGTQTDATVDNNWGQDGPPLVPLHEYTVDEHDNPDDPGEVTGTHTEYAHDNFSIRWTGYVQAPVAGNYTFTTETDDGVRLWIDGQLVINAWFDQGASNRSSPVISLAAGQVVPITMEYYENGGDAVARLKWTAAGVGSNSIIPQLYLYTSSAVSSQTTSSNNWRITGLTLPAAQGPAGNYRIVLTYAPSTGPTVATKYTRAFDVVNLPQAIIGFANLAKVLGSSAFALSSTSNSGGAPAYSIVSQNPGGTISLSGSTVTLLAVGTATLRVTYPQTATTAQTSADATLTVVSTPAAPVFTSASAVAFAIGQFKAFPVQTSGAPSPTFSIVGGSLPPWAALDLNTGILTGTPPNSSGSPFSVTIRADNSVGSATQVMTLSALAAPMIAVQPGPRAAVAGDLASFSVTAAGSPTLTYQWRKDGTAILNATGASYTLTAATGSIGLYDVVVANAAGSVTSPAVVFTLNVGPTITTNPANLSLPLGQPANFSVGVTGTASLSYQWRKGSTNLSGATASSLSLADIQPGDAGDYSVVISNAFGSATSAAGTLTVNMVVTPPISLDVKTRSARFMTIGWGGATAQTNIAGYEVMVNNNSIGQFTGELAEIRELSPGAANTIKIRARDANGNWSLWSAPLGASTLSNPDPPNASEVVLGDGSYMPPFSSHSLVVKAWGGGGGGGTGAPGGAGGYVTSTFNFDSSWFGMVEIWAGQGGAAGSGNSGGQGGDATHVVLNWLQSDYTTRKTHIVAAGGGGGGASGSGGAAGGPLTAANGSGGQPGSGAGYFGGSSHGLSPWTLPYRAGAGGGNGGTGGGDNSRTSWWDPWLYLEDYMAPTAPSNWIRNGGSQGTPGGGGGGSGIAGGGGGAAGSGGGGGVSAVANMSPSYVPYYRSFSSGIAQDPPNKTDPDYPGLGRSRGGNVGTQGSPGAVQFFAYNQTNARNIPDTQPPSAPTNFVLHAVTSTTFVVTWTCSDNMGINFYESRLNGAPVNGVGPDPYLNLGGLTPNTQYTFAARARDWSDNVGPWSADFVFTTTAAPSTITTHPASISVPQGLDAVFDVVATGNGLSYQWRKGAIPIQGAVSDRLTIPFVQPEHQGSYDVVVTNSGGSVTSNAATLTVTAPPPPPTITAQPQSTSAEAGTPASFTVTATGDGTLSYKWYREGVLIQSGTSNALNIAGAAAIDDANYYVIVVTPAGGTAKSSTVHLTVTVSNPSGHADSDGISNGIEFKLGTDPAVPNAIDSSLSNPAQLKVHKP